MIGKQASEIAERIKAEVSRAGDVVIAAVILAGTALVVALAALVIGVRPRAS